MRMTTRSLAAGAVSALAAGLLTGCISEPETTDMRFVVEILDSGEAAVTIPVCFGDQLYSFAIDSQNGAGRVEYRAKETLDGNRLLVFPLTNEILSDDWAPLGIELAEREEFATANPLAEAVYLRVRAASFGSAWLDSSAIEGLPIGSYLLEGSVATSDQVGQAFASSEAREYLEAACDELWWRSDD